jgi:hypothetical protein
MTLGGEWAELFAFRCPMTSARAVGIHVLTVRDGAGYLAMCFSTRAMGMQVLMRNCEDWLSSFRFLEVH